ncbi:MAG: hypothetical protein FGM55_07935, partial [Rhodoferax sp.]|nr:hypothetical protein [Rhodoferax sp.]
MIQRSLYALLFVAMIPIGTRVVAQNVYRCGNSYSAQPCPDGSRVDVADPRTPAQRQQAQDATERDARDAERLKQQRLKQDQARQGAARKTPQAPAHGDRPA